MNSEEVYLEAITRYLPSVLLQGNILIQAIEQPDVIEKVLQELFTLNNVPYPETEGQFKVEPVAEHSSENKVFLVTIPRAVNDIISYPYLLFAFAFTQQVVRVFLMSTNDINHTCALWEIVGINRVNRGIVTGNKEEILLKTFNILRGTE